MIFSLLLSVAPAPVQDGFEVAPNTLAWSALTARIFDLERRLDGVSAGEVDFVARAERLLALRFEMELADGTVVRSFADLAARAAAVRPAARERWTERLESGLPDEFRPWWGATRQLLLEDVLQSDDWDPDDDSGRDGIWEGPGWEPSKRDLEKMPWRGVRVDVRVEQAAALLFADLEAVKAAENDYRRYPENVGADYDWIYPVEDSYFVPADDESPSWSTLRLDFKCDLPFPFSGYRCDLRILNEIDDQGRLVTHIYSTSDDFYYMIGKDVFLPVDTSDGERVGYLLVRDFGFDLDGVPDKAKHRQAAIRSSLGNLKRRAQARFAESGREIEGGELTAVPEFRLLGKR